MAGREGCLDPPRCGEADVLELPLAKTGRKRQFYRASAIWVDRPAAVTVFRWHRGLDWADAAYGYAAPSPRGAKPFANDPSPGVGPFRRWRQALLLVATPRVRFWFDGDRLAVENLLAGLTHLGARRAVGFGRIADIIVRPCQEDYTVVGPDGAAARPVPVEEAPAGMRGPLAWTAYTPPYWDPQRRSLCYLPPVERWLPLDRPLPVGGKEGG